MTRPNVVLAAVLVLVASAGCLGGSAGGPATEAPTSVTSSERTAATASPTDRTAATTAGTTTGGFAGTPTTVECPADRDRYRKIAVEHVADEAGTDPANVSVVNDAFVDYPLLGECYYTAKVRVADSGRTLGAFVAENGTVVDRDTVEARADRVYERRYGNLSRDLYRRIRSADPGERIPVVVSVADIDRSAAKRAVDRENLTGAEYREALSDEYERRADRKTSAVVARLREIEGLTVESVGSLWIRVRATPDAVRTAAALDRVTRLDLRRETTTFLD